jgi:hypothetical protein
MPGQSELAAALQDALETSAPGEARFARRALAAHELAGLAALAPAITRETRLILLGKPERTDYVLSLSGVADAPAAALEDAVRLMTELAGGHDRLHLAMAAASECRVDTPFAPLRLIKHVDGSMSWCCTHKSGPHCSAA